jgi:hypothetical protein
MKRGSASKVPSPDCGRSAVPAHAPRDRRYQWVHLFGAVCPERTIGAATIMPEVNTEAMNEHLAEMLLVAPARASSAGRFSIYRAMHVRAGLSPD